MCICEWGVCLCCILYCILHLFKQCFNRQVDVVWSFHAFLVCVEVRVTDDGIGVVEVCKDLEGGKVGKSNVTVASIGYKHVIDGS